MYRWIDHWHNGCIDESIIDIMDVSINRSLTHQSLTYRSSMIAVNWWCINHQLIVPLGLFIWKPVFGTLGSQDSEDDTSMIDMSVIDTSICLWSIHQSSIFLNHWDSNHPDAITIIDDQFLSTATIVMIDDPFPWLILSTLALRSI